jgi:hypothetical protein
MPEPDFLDDTDLGSEDVGTAPQPVVFNHERWVRLRREQLGVDVIDPLGYDIGWAEAMNWRWAEGRQVNWRPLGRVKRILVGEFDHQDFYPGHRNEMDDEQDWSIFLVPDPPFGEIFGNSEDRDVECEITPHESFWDTGFFIPFWPFPGLLERKVGVYGPWVCDLGHDGKPEIHPCEVIWWRAAPRRGVTSSRFVLVMQDDSSRFDLPSDYHGSVPRPWSALPRRASIAVALRPRVGGHLLLNLHLLYAREMADMADPGAVSLTGAFDGQPVVTVTKQIENPTNVRMRISPVVPDPDGVHLRCFLYIGVQIGVQPASGDRGQAGYALLNLETMAPHGGAHEDPRVPPGGQEP